jgi:hypothetical protein
MRAAVWSAIFFSGSRAPAVVQTPALSVSGVSGAPGATVVLSVALNSSSGTLPASIQWDLTYSSSDLSLVTGSYDAIGGAGSAAGKVADCNSISAGDVRCIVSAINTTAIQSGVLATLTFQIVAGTTDSSTPVSLVNVAASDGNANPLSITASGATVTINQAPAAALSDLNCSPASVAPPATSTCTLSLSGPASSTATISLSSSAAAATVPASVNIAAGLSSRTFTVSTSAVGTNTTAVIAAALGSSSKTFSLTLKPALAATVSVTPSSGSGASQSFVLQYSDTAGAANLQQVWVYFNSTLANPASNACLLYYSAATNQINLLGDNGTAWQTAALGTAATLQNSQCSVNAAATTVALSGDMLTLNLAMTFKPAYAGTKNTYLCAIDISGTTSGWQQLGSWTVGSTTGTPATVSVTPSSGSGASQTFALQYSDTAGAASLQQVWAYFNSTLANPASNACLLYYSAAANQISLLGDNGTAWQMATLGAATTLQNSQCSINVAATAVVLSGNTLTLNLAMTFKPAYTGAKNVYSRAIDISGAASGWQPIGAWTVGSTTGAPATVSVTPSSGSGASQSFALQYSDTAGAASLQQVWVYFNSTLANPASNACLLYYSAATNQISLLGDNGTVWQTAALGAAATLQNSQCSINVATATVTSSGNTLTWNVPMTFGPAYAGAKNVYSRAIDISGAASGWQQLGSWTVVAAAGTPAVGSVTPGSGSGASQTFALQYSDIAGASSLQQVWAYFNSTLANPASNACLLYYSATTNQINLLGDNGTAWQTATPGAATTLQNSQCSLNVAATTVVLSGNTLTLNLAMTFEPAYAGAKNIYMYASDASGANSGWQQLGAWTVSSGLGALAAAVP